MQKQIQQHATREKFGCTGSKDMGIRTSNDLCRVLSTDTQAGKGRQADRQTDSLHTCTFDIPDLQSTVKHATPNEAPIMVVGTGSHSDSARLG